MLFSGTVKSQFGLLDEHKFEGCIYSELILNTKRS